jgi:hypothetical protein
VHSLHTPRHAREKKSKTRAVLAVVLRHAFRSQMPIKREKGKTRSASREVFKKLQPDFEVVKFRVRAVSLDVLQKNGIRKVRAARDLLPAVCRPDRAAVFVSMELPSRSAWGIAGPLSSQVVAKSQSHCSRAKSSGHDFEI